MRTVTFYSYKGGMGRTLLLANLAVLAARVGQRVVALDFDLEAPGLPYKLLGQDIRPSIGLVDWLREVFESGEPPATLQDYVLDVPVDDVLVDGGWLKVMPAGRAPSPNYFQDLQRLRLDRRLDDGTGVDALVELQRRIGDELRADHLLIDARTGITSTNSITTHVLADDVVALTLGTPEQLEGTRAVLRGLRPTRSLRTGEPLRIRVVLSRVPPKPPDVSPMTRTEAEEAQMRDVRSFLNEPGQPARFTLDVQEIFPVHTDLAFTRGEFLSFAGDGPQAPATQVFHADQWAIARAIFGTALTNAADSLMDGARTDPARMAALAGLFVAPERLLEARGIQERSGVSFEEVERSSAGWEADVAVLRDLAVREPSVRPRLASQLMALASHLRDLGRHEEASAAIEEAVALYRDLAAARPEAFTPDLATSLNNLSNRLGALGRREDALAAIEEAVPLRRDLAAARPEAFTPDLAGSLNNLSNRLGALGRREDALAAIEEAVPLYRDLAAARPEAFTPDLAGSLNNLSTRLSDLGRREEALAAIEEAVALYRDLAAERPEVFTFNLATSLNNLSKCLYALGHREEALAAIEEAVALYRDLAAERPEALTGDLAGSLNNLSKCLHTLGHREEALAPIEEAVAIFRDLAAARPEVFIPDLATSLNNLSVQFGTLGRREEALAAIEEAVALRRDLTAARPEAFTPDLAGSLNNLSTRLSDLGRREEALAAIEEAVALHRDLAAARPEVFTSDLATSLNNLSDRLGDLGREEEAEGAKEEATRLVGQLLAAREGTGPAKQPEG